MTEDIDRRYVILEAMAHQPILNIGMIGHVSHGKSSIVKSLTGISTQKHSSEKQKNITIKLGYANVKLYQCPKCLPPKSYQTAPSDIYKKKCSFCETDMILLSHISFVDCPGHVRFMSTMIGGTCIMDTTMLVVAIDDNTLPAPQAKEHLNAITLGGIKNSIICLNKFDLVKKDIGLRNIKILQAALKGTIAADSPMVPISATVNINIDVLCEYLSNIPVPIRDLTSSPKMIIVRSYNINKPGTSLDNLSGGVIGGSILCGKINISDEVELRPGYYISNETGKNRFSYKPLHGKIISIFSEKNKLESAIPGGLIGIQLDIDPALSANDGLVGQMMTKLGSDSTSAVYEEITLSYTPLDKSITLKKDDILEVNINACNTKCKILTLPSTTLTLQPDKPISISPQDKIVISYNGKIFGTATIINGTQSHQIE
ncbi:MAG: eukaryotic translation initiation factor 2 gamma subunit [Hyperionvirus sp.]|uniref:Eukaryotic translation initiation factor 2 gamma subunit n=1 Tax=Hyperionvirus sp. TaxID=2487770 RepID=A0A3G5AHN0_9VIRU|nr:MAG: eukaryotic translation initiation factor 2 gamma subunit [Hyperionvirus sp.]